MNDSPQYEAFRAFARSEIRAQRLEFKEELAKELRAEFKEILTRDAAKIIEGPPGPAGKDGRDGIDGKPGTDGKDGAPGERGTDGTIGRDGKDGLNGTDGKPGEKGERGADGIATREELRAAAQEMFADFQVRNFADTYQGVYEPNRTYTRGVLVTWGGSLWLSQTEAKTKPGESSDWKLVVKKGSDGRK